MLTYTIDKARNLVVLTGTGTVTVTEFRELQKRGRADRDFDPSRPILLDLAAADLREWTSAEVRALAAGGVNVRRAILVAGDLSYGLGRMLQAESGMLGQENVRVFRERDGAEALAWVVVVDGPVPRHPSSHRIGVLVLHCRLPHFVEE
jgi:hypothetical protein